MPSPSHHPGTMSKSSKKHDRTSSGTAESPQSSTQADLRSPTQKKLPVRSVVDRSSDTPMPQAEIDGIVIISATGDVVLDAEAEEGGEVVLLRVDSTLLRHNSAYFDRLLDVKYSEGLAVAKHLEELRQSYSAIVDVLATELPHLKVSYLGQTSVKTIRPLMTDFMNILHSQDHTSRKLPLVNLANLAIVTDRFDACPVVKRWADKKNLFISPSSVKAASNAIPSEESTRQRLLVGFLLKHESWVTGPSAQLIINGSSRWSDEDVEAPAAALWWDLPGSMEEELQYRHALVLETIDSLVTHHLALFTSKTRQCRLGYDTSPQCDSFQLGEFVKFLTRYNLFRLRSTFSASVTALSSDDNEVYESTSSILAVIKTLRQCPSYQLDPHHSHCGPRNGLLHGLDFLKRHLTDAALGICLECWRDPGAEHVWSRARRPLRWGGKAAHGGGGGPRWAWSGKGVEVCVARGQHDAAREMFLAEERDWGSV